jgi:hypothetical protein
MTEYGKCRYDITLQPVSGKAIPVRQGEVLRIIQAAGKQCVDFNCFNLHDHKERMSVGDMRMQGFRVKQGHVVVSAPPRYHPMMAILDMAETCVSDLLGARCDATAGEREYGLVPRTNCQDTFTEAIREYRLTPDDVHDSFNMWMHTIWEDSYYALRNVGRQGDYVNLLALMDVLAVPIICGSGDIGQISNFSLNPIQVQVYEPSEQTREAMRGCLDRCSGFKNQRTREDFRIKDIPTERKLEPVPGYQPQFRTFPVEETEIEVKFTAAEIKAIKAMRGKMGKTDEAVVRAAFMLWYQQNRMEPHWIQPDGPMGLSRI